MATTDEYVLDPARTRIGFIAAHRVGGRVRGCFGTFAGGVCADHAWLSVELDSVDTGNPRRDDQLRKDFFDTAEHPAMTFETTAVEQVSESRYDVTGDLTIRGTTHALTIPFELTDAGDTLHFTARTTLDRHTWHANWNTFTRALVHPDIVVDLEVTATRYSQAIPSWSASSR